MIRDVRDQREDAELIRRCQIWLQVARKDLAAAEFLYCQKMYPQAVFYLQQSVEKAVKSLGIWGKVITETEARDIVRHNARKIYHKMLESSKKWLTHIRYRSQQLPAKYGRLTEKANLDSALRELDWLKTMFPDEESLLHISSSKSDIVHILQAIQIMREFLVNDLAKKGTKFATATTDDTTFLRYRESVHRRLEAAHEGSREKLKEEKEALDRIVTPDFVSIYGKTLLIAAYSQFCYYSLLLLHGVFSPHAARTRYPFMGINPLESYTDHLPLVQMLGAFIEIIKQVLEALDSLFTEISNLSKR